MASTLHQAWGYSRWVGCVVLVATVGAHAVAAQDRVAPGANSRLRPVDQKAAALLQAGAARSATFRALVDTIEQSDLVVYIETGQLTRPGQLEFVSATPGGRYVRVAVRVMGVDNDLLPWLAHELWHAVEIASEPAVRDQASLVTFYERIGSAYRSRGEVLMETVKAQETQETVLRELLRPELRAAR
jgi:hypothetical protein